MYACCTCTYTCRWQDTSKVGRLYLGHVGRGRSGLISMVCTCTNYAVISLGIVYPLQWIVRKWWSTLLFASRFSHACLCCSTALSHEWYDLLSWSPPITTNELLQNCTINVIVVLTSTAWTCLIESITPHCALSERKLLCFVLQQNSILVYRLPWELANNRFQAAFPPLCGLKWCMVQWQTIALLVTSKADSDGNWNVM